MDEEEETASGFGSRVLLAGSFVNGLVLDDVEPASILNKTQRKRRKREKRKLNFRYVFEAVLFTLAHCGGGWH